MGTGLSAAGSAQSVAADYLTLGWALKRALLGIVILTVAIGGFAWLLHTTIDPDQAARAEISGTATGIIVPESPKSGF